VIVLHARRSSPIAYCRVERWEEEKKERKKIEQLNPS
jgi:hypothetical protein